MGGECSWQDHAGAPRFGLSFCSCFAQDGLMPLSEEVLVSRSRMALRMVKVWATLRLEMKMKKEANDRSEGNILSLAGDGRARRERAS